MTTRLQCVHISTPCINQISAASFFNDFLLHKRYFATVLNTCLVSCIIIIKQHTFQL